MLNIPSTVNDPKYRYRMPKMQVKIESKGNGIKSNIVNLNEVAKHLRTDEQYILKFFGFQKASQTTFKEAGGKNNTNYIINGEFSEEDLRKVLDKYIEKYICCPKCKLPEMHMYIVNQKINGKCDSCPFVGELDNKHKLTAFILKNPPVAKNMATGKNQKKEEVKTNTLTITKQKKKEEKQKDRVEEVDVTTLFNANNMDFGSEQLQNLIIFIKKQLEALQNEDFDIKSAKIVSKIKPIGLKRPLIAYILFKVFFTVNISKEVVESAKIYLNLMKKLVGLNVELETLLNLEYLFLETSKDKDYSKYLPTILYNISKQGLFSEQFLINWDQNKIADIEKNYFYSAQRDSDFKALVQPYLNSLGQNDQQEDQQEQNQQKKAEESNVSQPVSN